jgi:hypothetical protein
MCIPTVQLSSPAGREPENGLLCGLSGSFRLKFLYVFDFSITMMKAGVLDTPTIYFLEISRLSTPL